MGVVADELIGVYRAATGTAYPRAIPRAADVRANGLNNRAVSLLDLNRRGEAEALLERALATDPHHAEAAYNLGLLHWRWGRRTDEALIGQLAEAAAAHADRWQDAFRIGLVHLERGDADEAIRALETAARQPDAGVEVTPALKVARAGAGVWMGCLQLLDCPSAWYAHHLLLSHDGWLALFDADTAIEMWDLNAGQRLRRLCGPGGAVTALALSADGRHLLSAHRKGTLNWWHLSTGRCLRTIQDQCGVVGQLSLSADGRYALAGAVAGETLILREWDLDNGRCVSDATLATRADVHGPCVSPDHRRAAWADAGRLHVWDLARNRSIETIRVGETIDALALDWQHDRAVTAGARHGIRLWELANGDCVTQGAGHGDRVTALALADDGRRAVTAGRDQMLRLWDLTAGRCLRTASAGDGVLIALDRDGRRAVTRSLCGTGCTLRIWSLRQAGEHPAPLALARPRPVAALVAQAAQMQETLCDVRATLESGEPAAALARLATIRESDDGRDSAVRDLWRDVGRYGRCTGLCDVWRVQQLGGAGPLAGITPDGRWAVAAGDGGMVLRVWDLANGTPLRLLRPPTSGGPLCSAVVMPDGRSVMAGRLGGEMLHWDLATGRLVRALHLKHVEAERVLISVTPDGSRMLRGMGNSIQVWDLASGRCMLNGVHVHSLRSIRAVAIGPDGRSGLSCNAAAALFWDLGTGRILRRLQGHTATVLSLAISPDGRTALSGSADRTVRHWDLVTGRRLATLAGHTARVLAVAYGPDPRWAFSASADRTIRIWELATGRCLQTLDGHTGAVPSIALTPDGRWLLSGGTDEAVCLWELDWDYTMPAPADWHEGARPYLQTFLTRYYRRSAATPPYWDRTDFELLLAELQRRGYGWLRPDGVRHMLEDMTAAWTGPPPLM
jgi:WD40 repeat protein